MSRKDYQMIAEIISRIEPGLRDSVARMFASELLNTNPRFNMRTFLTACNARTDKENVK